MRHIRGALILLILLLAVPLVVALFIKKEYSVERHCIIKKDNHEVFDYIRIMKNQQFYNKWLMTDPKTKFHYIGTDGQPGFVLAWDSTEDDVGKGEQEMTKIDNGKSVDYEIRFIRPISSTSRAFLHTDSITPSLTNVTWRFEGKMPYPFNLMRLILQPEQVLGADLDSSLVLLKKELEK
jgi:hypothetical protein